MTPVMKINVTRVMSICYPGDWSEKHILSILHLRSYQTSPQQRSDCSDGRNGKDRMK